MSFPENWRVDRSEDEIEIIDIGTAKELEDKAEEDANHLFKSVGIAATRITRSDQKTSDYGGMGVDFEVTIVHVYMRGVTAIERAWEFLQKNIGTCYCAYIYSDSKGKPVFEILTEERASVTGLSVLCLRQHVSIYRKKIINKIGTEYRQNTTNPHQIVVLDFRVAPFNSSSLRNEISRILKQIGGQYHYLLGVIFALPRTIGSSPFAQPDYYYVSNPYVDPPKAISEKLQILEKVGNDVNLSIMPMIPLVVIPHTNEEHSMCTPCLNCPSIDDLASLGMPVL